MRAVRAFLCLALLSVSMGGTAIAAVDEQWPTPDTPQDGYYSVEINDSIDIFNLFSRLETSLEDEVLLCTSMSSGDCAQSNVFTYTAVLPPCASERQTNCVAELSAIHSNGRKDVAEFAFFTTPDHPNLFAANPAARLPEGSSPGAWVFPDTPHSAGNMYGLAATLSGAAWRLFPKAPENISILLSPVSRKVGTGRFTGENGYENFPKCQQLVDPTTGKRKVGCGSGAEELGKYVCAFKIDSNGDCLLRQPFPPDTRFKVSLRLADQPSGWLHGRMADPEIAIERQSARQTMLNVTAAPVSVPIFYAGGQYSDLPEELRAYFAECLPSNMCPHSSRQYRPFGEAPRLEERNVMEVPAPYSPHAMRAMRAWLDYAKDTSVAVPTAWTMRTLSVSRGQQDACLAPDSSGVTGIVTTNATAYSDGPPSFSDGQLKYSVMSPHFEPDGATAFLGRYNLLLRSDVARCLYRFSSAPIQAKIEVLDAKGTQTVAVTSVAESKGWLSLAASGFTFSNPTINVTLSQTKAGSATKAKKSLTCVNSKTGRLVRISAVKPKCPAGTRQR